MIDRMPAIVAYVACVAWLMAFVPTLVVAMIAGGDMRTDYLILALTCCIMGRLMDTHDGGRAP